ncbi:unnamed protein product [Chondrus crispus]|uniref:Uncharacterized protein n=1 Tax=Chondrus crispus TaxID=2769 RepID=R7QP59_CHOCR|nr:unnamed protein product [Chondrus crispus]CDF40287.1 unnamed protein product [Chondrus crispus]|eukprot:XP_005710581.1 unnamed protein product [Chondrus crispus]
MAAEQTPALFLAASPYVPEETVRQLREAFGKRARLAPPVKQSLLHNDQNFVERELAVRCGCFIGDFASTWSGTVYYKRRTLGLKTHWTSVLLEKSKTLGYYAEEERIPRPEELEAKFAVAGI